MQRDNKVRHQSPNSIRNEVFGHKLRGLDEDEVRDYLDELADQVQRMGEELVQQSREIDDLRVQNNMLRERAQVAERAASEQSPHAAAILSQAQQVADMLVEEAVARASEVMRQARKQSADVARDRPPADDNRWRPGATAQFTPVRRRPAEPPAPAPWGSRRDVIQFDRSVRRNDQTSFPPPRPKPDTLGLGGSGGSSSSDSSEPSIYEQLLRRQSRQFE